ncbi:MFS transporter [Paraburkholderia phytofirmans]|uniref:MFS transporter n=1 Tax=Paraburkholderia phytofirmans TaxID=261302 RepID=UPI0038BDFC1C
MQTSLSDTAVAASLDDAVERPTPGIATLIIASALGNGLEVFDFTVFSFFATYIGTSFFPNANPLMSLLFAVGTFGAGFLARPVGAAMIGGYADRAGRRSAMTLSIWLMAVGTAAIALCPTYATLGVAAPLIVLAGRLTQGFAAGGEIGASTAYVMEIASEKQRGTMISSQGLSQGLAAIAGALCGLLLIHTMDPKSLSAWGWRIPFVLGLLIAPVGVYIRRRLPESHVPESRHKANHPLWMLLSHYRAKLLTAVAIMLSQTVTMYVVVYFMPSYLGRVMNYPPATGFAAAITSSLAIGVGAVLGGRLSDRLQRPRWLALICTSLNLLVCFPSFWVLVHTSNTFLVVSVCAAIAALTGVGGTASTLLIMEMFPASIRASGFSIAYAVAVTLFGGTAQLVATTLILKTGDSFAAAYYVFACLAVTWVTLLRTPDRSA